MGDVVVGAAAGVETHPPPCARLSRFDLPMRAEPIRCGFSARDSRGGRRRGGHACEQGHRADKRYRDDSLTGRTQYVHGWHQFPVWPRQDRRFAPVNLTCGKRGRLTPSGISKCPSNVLAELVYRAWTVNPRPSSTRTAPLLPPSKSPEARRSPVANSYAVPKIAFGG